MSNPAPSPSSTPAPRKNRATHQAPRPGRTSAASKCVYFADESDVDQLEALIAKFPRASLSSVINQLVQRFNEAALALPEDERCVVLNNAKIWI